MHKHSKHSKREVSTNFAEAAEGENQTEKVLACFDWPTCYAEEVGHILDDAWHHIWRKLESCRAVGVAHSGPAVPQLRGSLTVDLQKNVGKDISPVNFIRYIPSPWSADRGMLSRRSSVAFRPRYRSPISTIRTWKMLHPHRCTIVVILHPNGSVILSDPTYFYWS